MRVLSGILGIAAAVAVSLSAGTAQAAFDFTDTATCLPTTGPGVGCERYVYVDAEGLRAGPAANGLTCRNLFNNPAGLPPTPVGACVPSPAPGGTVGCPYHPNNRAADPSCTVHASSADSADGPFFIVPPYGPIASAVSTAIIGAPGDPSNDYWTTATFVGGSVWNIAATDDVWAEVSDRTLGASGAAIFGTPAPLSYNIDFSATGPGSVLPTVTFGPSSLPEFYRVDGDLGGFPLAAFGVGLPVDDPWFGQAQNPTITVADAGLPLAFSCNAGANITPPVTISTPYVNTSTTPGVLTDPTVTTLNDFFAACAPLGAFYPPASTCGSSTVAIYWPGPAPGPATGPGIRLDITSASTASSLAIAPGGGVGSPTLGFVGSVGDYFIIEAYNSLGGAPFPKYDGAVPGFPQTAEAALCPNAVGGSTGLSVEPGYDLASSPGTTQHTNFVAAFTTALGAPATTPVWSPLDNRLEEAADTDSDGIPDAFDNCVLVPNGPLLDVESPASPTTGCYLSLPPAVTSVGSTGFVQVDTDGDGYGNPCDGDFNQDGAANTTDTGAFSSPPDLFSGDLATGIDSGIGSDMNCDGAVNTTDTGAFSSPPDLFSAQLGAGSPGPSGLYCAGTSGCTF